MHARSIYVHLLLHNSLLFFSLFLSILFSHFLKEIHEFHTLLDRVDMLLVQAWERAVKMIFQVTSAYLILSMVHVPARIDLPQTFLLDPLFLDVHLNQKIKTVVQFEIGKALDDANDLEKLRVADPDIGQLPL